MVLGLIGTTVGAIAARQATIRAEQNEKSALASAARAQESRQIVELREAETRAVLILSIQNLAYDLDGNLQIDDLDRLFWVHELAHTYLGDSNLDHQFNSTDMVVVFEAGGNF